MRKGAFELSMGFIVTVVFAIVLLTFALLFIQGFFNQISDQSGKWNELANNKLDEAFAENDIGFNIYPEQLPADRNTKVSVTAGVKNTAGDGETHSFVTNIVVQEVPNGVSKASLESWIDFVRSPSAVTAGGTKKVPIYMTIPSSAKSGQYFFDIVSCIDVDKNGRKIALSSATCLPDSQNIWGSSAKTFVLTVN